MKIRRIAMGTTAAALGVFTLHRVTAQAEVPLALAVEQAADGKAVYLKSCKDCHGVLGVPTKASLRKYKKIPDFTDATWFKQRQDSVLVKAVANGKGRDMKGFADKLSEREITAVVAYIHTLHK